MQDKPNNDHTEHKMWIAVDWGTSTLRCWAMQNDQATQFAESTKGMSKLHPDEFEPALLELIDNWLPENQTTLVLACGMVGAKQGWIEAPYISTPCNPTLNDHTVKALVKDFRINCVILPGISQQSPADVMRGEETLIAGLTADNARFSGVICLPGTHCKWVKLVNGTIESFNTVMTGELFALISTQSVLRFNANAKPMENNQQQFDDAFVSAVKEYARSPTDLTKLLFSIRAQALLNDTSSLASTARLSGLLIAADVHSMKSYWQNAQCIIVGGPALSSLYQLAISTLAMRAPQQIQIKSMDNLVLKGLSRCAQQLGIA